ncbi:hypothetical protein FB451DRAFT_1527490 [Mycena latifolia]|nr:hypothetical protein FB451DRAFT_1527490 [Mycena latifolia]
MPSSPAATLRDSLVEIDAALFHHRRLVHQLEERRQAVQSQLDAVIYPIFMLPLEITAEIFLQCLASSRNKNPHPYHFPTVFLGICRQWRAIALSIPALWASIHLDFDYDMPRTFYDEGGVEGFVDRCFKLACARPLSLALRGLVEEGLGSARVSSIIRSHAPRIQSLELEMDLFEFDGIDIGPLSSLQNLTIGLPYNEREELSLANPIQIFATAPQLRAVHLRYNANPATTWLPWEQLTTFTGDGFTIDDCLDVLHLTPSLIDCTFTVARDSETTTTTPITHHKLQNFRLACNNNEESTHADILDLIRLPALRSLQLANIEGLDADDHIFLQFLSHSAASLRQFSFSGSRTARMGAWSKHWFFAMARLAHVEVIHPDSDFTLNFLSLLNRYHEKRFLPHLQTLTLAGYGFPIDRRLIMALSSRCTAAHGAVHLRSFRLIWPDTESWELDDAVTAPLERHIARGINIYMGPPDRN